MVPKFYPDEAAVLNATLAGERDRMCAFMASFPLIAVAPCGVVLTHGSPAATEPTLEAFERIGYEGFDGQRPLQAFRMQRASTLIGLLWSRSARPSQARALLKTCAEGTSDGAPAGFVAFGHDVVWEGYERLGPEQLRLSTSFGCLDQYKAYLRLDLSHRYRSADELREGEEIRWLYR